MNTATVEQITPYEQLQAPADVLARLQAIAPKLGSLRVDAAPGQPSIAFLDKMPRRITVQLDAPGTGPEEHARAFLGITEEQAAEFLEGLRRLAEINPAGCWLLRDRLPAQLDPVREGSFEGGAACGLLNDTIADLSRDMRHIHRFEVDETAQGTQGGFSRRRVFLRAIDIHGREVAALDTALFTPTIRILAGLRDGASRVNLARAKVWAQQLEVPLAHLAHILHDLSMLTVVIPAGGIVLKK